MNVIFVSNSHPRMSNVTRKAASCFAPHESPLCRERTNLLETKQMYIILSYELPLLTQILCVRVQTVLCTHESLLALALES